MFKTIISYAHDIHPMQIPKEMAYKLIFILLKWAQKFIFRFLCLAELDMSYYTYTSIHYVCQLPYI